jgi:hypothetical protein
MLKIKVHFPAAVLALSLPPVVLAQAQVADLN